MGGFVEDDPRNHPDRKKNFLSITLMNELLFAYLMKQQSISITDHELATARFVMGRDCLRVELHEVDMDQDRVGTPRKIYLLQMGKATPAASSGG